MTIRFEGHAIVSADGMIANGADEHAARCFRNDADWHQFQAALDRAALVVLGRKGHDRHPNPGRRRLVLTRETDGLEADGAERLVLESGDDADRRRPRGARDRDGIVAITGGTGTFDLFAPLVTAFDLSEVHGLVLPDGMPCFSEGHPRVVLAALGLAPGSPEPLGGGVTLTRWRAASYSPVVR